METFAREKFQKFRDTATFKVLSPFILTVYRYMVSVIKWSEIYMYSSEYLLTITKNLRYFIPCIFFTLIGMMGSQRLPNIHWDSSQVDSGKSPLVNYFCLDL